MDEREIQHALDTLSSLEVIQPNQRICTRNGKIVRDDWPWIAQMIFRLATGQNFEKNCDDVSSRIKDIFRLINIGIDMEDKTCQELKSYGNQPYSSNLNFVRQQTSNRKNLKLLCTAMYKSRKGMIEMSETYRKLGNDLASSRWTRLAEYTMDELCTLEKTWNLLKTKFPTYAMMDDLFVRDNQVRRDSTGPDELLAEFMGLQRPSMESESSTDGE